MKIKLQTITILAIFLTLALASGCANHGTQVQYQQQPATQPNNSNYVQLTGGIPGKGHQPPAGFKTKRTEIAKILAFKINYWGLPGDPLDYDKGMMIQKWKCGTILVYNVFFRNESEARAFLSSPNRDQMLREWRTTLDNTPMTPDPSRKGADMVMIQLN